MFRALQNLLGVQPWRTNIEVWADVVSFNEEMDVVTVLFTTTPSFARDPQFLSRWGWQARAMAQSMYPPRTAQDHMLRQWVMAQIVPNRVTTLLRETDLGFELFGADLAANRQLLGVNYSPHDHNGAMLRLNCNGPVPLVIGAIGTQAIALERLSALHRVGAKPLVAARVQANHTLYASGIHDAPAMVAFSFDPAVPPLKIEEVALMLGDLKETDTTNPVLLAAAAGPRASDEGWFYHRRFRIPPELTEGRVIYVADIWIHRPFLPDRCFSDRTPRLVPVLAQPGDVGGVELIPHDRVGQIFPPDQASLFRLRG